MEIISLNERRAARDAVVGKMGPAYRDAATYNRGVAALAAAGCDPDRIKIALGELLDVWPASIAGDV